MATDKTRPADHFDNPTDPEFDGSWEDAAVIAGESFGEVVEFATGTVFVGKYTGTAKDIDTDYGTIDAHRFTDSYGMPVTVWGSHDLDGKIADIEVGQLVRIELVKVLALKGGKTLKLFKVQVR